MKAIMISLGMALIAISVFAQQGPPKNMQTAEERAKQNTERLKTELALTADQEKKVQEINLASAKKMDEIFKNSQGDRDAAREKIKVVKADQDKQIKALLTADQIKKYDALIAKMEAERQQKHQGGGQGQPTGTKPPTQ
jgi:hypothetical protein